MAGPFDDELTPEEEALLRADQTVPPPEDGEGTVEQAVTEAEPTPTPTPEAQPAAAEQPPTEQQPAPSQAEAEAEDKAFADWLEKNKDKSPEELQRLAFQQSKRANRSEAGNRQVREQVAALAERARRAAATRDEVAKTAPQLREEFNQRLQSDPDAATQWLFDQMVNQQVSQADAEAQSARIDEAIGFADAHIPNFGTQWPGMHSLARELGYSDDEVNAIDDARPLITLYLASKTAALMKAGIMDRYGNLTSVPQPEPQPVDPRLAAPTPQRTLGGGARSTRANASLEQQLADIANMSDAELTAFETANPGAIDNLLRQAAA